jgi:hypothetical protein
LQQVMAPMAEKLPTSVFHCSSASLPMVRSSSPIQEFIADGVSV